MINLRSKQVLYESIMNDISKLVKQHLNELAPGTYRNAADKRAAQINDLPGVVKRDLTLDQKKIVDRLRHHADNIETGDYPDITNLPADKKADLQLEKIIKSLIGEKKGEFKKIYST